MDAKQTLSPPTFHFRAEGKDEALGLARIDGPVRHRNRFGPDLFERFENDFDTLSEHWNLCQGELPDSRQINTKVFVNQHIT